MKQFNVFVNDKIGELARMTEALAQSAINIRGIATDRLGPKPTVKVITDDETSTRKALAKANFAFEESEVLVIDLIDRPGEIARIARKAARAGVNIDSVFLIGKKGTPASLAMATKDSQKVEQFLKENSK